MSLKSLISNKVSSVVNTVVDRVEDVVDHVESVIRPEPKAAPRPVDTVEVAKKSPTSLDGRSWVDKAAPAGDAKPIDAADVDPLELVGRVRNGDVDLEIPLNKGSLGPFDIHEGTVLRFHATVRDGELVMDSVRGDFVPDLDGPLWANARGLKVSHGKFNVDVAGAPDIQLGPRLPTDMGGLVDSLRGIIGGGDVGVSFFGFEVAHLGADGAHLDNPLGIIPAAPYVLGSIGNETSSADELVDVRGIRINLDNVELEPGPLALGGSGSIDIEEGSRFDIHGNPADLRVEGHANVRNVNIDTAGVRLNGGAGEADVSIHFLRNADGTGTVDASLSNLDVETQYAVARRSNGDWISLADGQLDNGALRVSERISFDGTRVNSVTQNSATLTVESFSGTIEGGQLTIPDGDGTAKVTLGRSTLSGSLSIRPDAIALDGEFDGQATISGYHVENGSSSADIRRAELSGSGQVQFDTRRGLSIEDANLRLKAEITRARLGATVPVVGGASAEVGAGSTVDVNLRGVSFSQKHGLQGIDGAGLAVDLTNLSGTAQGHTGNTGPISFEGDSSRLPSANDLWNEFQEWLRANGAFVNVKGANGEATREAVLRQLHELSYMVGQLAGNGSYFNDLRRLASYQF